MLEQMPEYQALTDEEKDEILRRFARIEAKYRFPEREQRQRAELQRIVQELRAKSAPKKG